jgi:hypothetical protein
VRPSCPNMNGSPYSTVHKFCADLHMCTCALYVFLCLSGLRTLLAVGGCSSCARVLPKCQDGQP